MKEKNKLRLIISNLDEIISGIFIIITTILVIINVFLRYFMKTGLYWSEEVATGCFVWAVFIGAAASYKKNQHIGVDFIIEKLPENIKRFVKVIINIILLIVNGYLAYLSVVYLSNSYVKPTPVLGISSAYISSALTVSFSLMTIYSIIFLYDSIKQYSKKGVL